MAYEALIAAWNSSVQPPAGITGVGLSSGMTRAQKVAAINDWTVVGPPQPLVVPTTDIYNVIVPSEWVVLPSSRQQDVRDILYMGTVNASSGSNVRAMLLTIFSSATTTRVNLAALAAKYDSPQIPWWQSVGYIHMITADDASAAGVS